MPHHPPNRADQSDPEGQCGTPVLQTEKLELEDVGGAAASKREPTLDGESGSSAAAAAVRFLSAAKARVSVLEGVRDVPLRCGTGLRRGASAPQADGIPVAVQTSTSVEQVAGVRVPKAPDPRVRERGPFRGWTAYRGSTGTKFGETTLLWGAWRISTANPAGSRYFVASREPPHAGHCSGGEGASPVAPQSRQRHT